jgi:3-deoxy-D-manno-octulosonic-acid transferase
LEELGCPADVIEVLGSLKFDSAKVHERRLLDVPALLRQIGVPDDALVLVGGSTHAGEESILAEVIQRLRVKFPKLFLVVVPRHHERGAEAGRALAAHGVKFVFRSEIIASTQRSPGEVQCLLVNTTGELRYFYERADLVFVGKSLTAEGGQNPIEPAALGKPVLFGPHMQNFPHIVPQFLARKAVRQVADAAELERALEELLAKPELRAELGERARAVVQENLGGIEKTVDMIVREITQ